MNTPAHSKKPIEVVCAIIFRNGTLLAAQRSDKLDQLRSWEFPGGKVEEGESIEEAVHREIREELGIGISIKKMLKSTFLELPAKTFELIPVLCAADESPVSFPDHSQVRWLRKQDLWTLGWLAGDIPIVEEIELRWEEFVSLAESATFWEPR